MTIRMAMVIGTALLLACMPETDREHYAAGESGVATFENTTLATLYLGGCSHFDYEKQIGDAWVSQGPDVVCVWEGFAKSVLPGAVVTDPIQAREPGTWRLRYPVGIDCSVTTPLREEHCRAIGHVTSNPFEVHERGCVPAPRCRRRRRSRRHCRRARLPDGRSSGRLPAPRWRAGIQSGCR
jgi:hypothetical protein